MPTRLIQHSVSTFKARTMELRAEIAERNKEIAETFARILSNPAQFETVGEPTPHNIKFVG
jgi:hypothetical protein